MISAKSPGQTPSVAPATPLSPHRVIGVQQVISRSTSHALMAAMLQTSAMRVAEVYGAYGPTVGTLWERTEARRQSYRSYLVETVVRASPFVLDTASPEEIELALRAMMPPPSWLKRPSTAIGWQGPWRSPERVLNGAKNYRASAIGSRAYMDVAFARPFRVEGHVVRYPSHPLGGLGIRPVGDCLEVMLLIRGTLIVTWRDLVRIATPTPLPETIAIAARGHLLSELIDSPIFAGRDYRIRNVSVTRGMSIFTASAPSQAYPISEIAD